MEYRTRITIPETTKNFLNHILNHPPLSESDCFSEDETLSYTATFPNGYEADIQCCGVQYWEGELNLPWTQGILYDNYGREIQVSEPSDDYFGEWNFSVKKDSYIVFVG